MEKACCCSGRALLRSSARSGSSAVGDGDMPAIIPVASLLELQQGRSRAASRPRITLRRVVIAGPSGSNMGPVLARLRLRSYEAPPFGGGRGCIAGRLTG